MALQVQVFNNFSPAKWEAFKAKIEGDTGVKLEDPAVAGEGLKPVSAGTVEHGSFVFTYKYDPAAEVLTIQCLKKPLFIKASIVTEGITEEIAELKV